MLCVKKTVLVAACLTVLVLLGCNGESLPEKSNDTNASSGRAEQAEQAEQVVVQPGGSASSAELPPDAMTVEGPDGEVFHYTVDPCAIAPAAEVEEFLGSPVTSEFSFVYGIPPYTRCEFAVELPEEERAGRSPDRLTISVVEPLTLSEAGFPGMNTGEDAYNRLKQALTNAGTALEDIRDLGDKAFLQSSEGVLHVLQGDIYLRVAANIYTKESAATLEELHKKMADYNAKVAMRFTADHLLPGLKAQ